MTPFTFGIIGSLLGKLPAVSVLVALPALAIAISETGDGRAAIYTLWQVASVAGDIGVPAL